MELTGKAKEQFEEWYELNYEAIGLPSIDDEFYLSGFYELPDSMQFGVYVDFADSVGMLIDTDVVWEVIALNENVYEYTIKNKQELLVLGDGFAYTRREARELAVNKLNQIINN
jgi:hypothetical protein